MEASDGNSDAYRASSGHTSVTRNGLLSASNLIQAPLSTLLEFSGLFPTRSNHQDSEPFINPASSASANGGEVSIRIIGVGEQHNDREVSELVTGQVRESSAQSEVYMQPTAGPGSAGLILGGQVDRRTDRGAGEGTSLPNTAGFDGEAAEGGGANGTDSFYQRYNVQQAARWMEQVLPFSLLLLVVFIRQHLQGFFVTTWIAAVMLKSNEMLQKQTAMKGERKISILIGTSLAVMLHVVGVYWWFKDADLLYPLVMLPPKSIPPFWHAIFIIMVNDTLVRLSAMLFKCLLLIYYKNSRRRNYRTQGQMLTLVEYLVLLYRALLPTPVWYRFLLNKEYGSLFSSLMTGLYLTFKLTSVVEKVQSFFSALKALSRKEVHFGAQATSEQVNETGDLCAICQEKMHAPILLRCKHIFCEDCVSEWFEKERTCPLCRTLVKSADLRSFGDGSTSLFFQIF